MPSELVNLIHVLVVCAFVCAPIDATADEADQLTVIVWNVQRGANNFDQGPEKAAVLPKEPEDNDIPQAKRLFPSDHGAVVIRMKWGGAQSGR